MASEAEKILSDFLNRMQKNARIRAVLAIALLIALLGVGGYLLYDIMPRQHALTITGGDILSNRHFLAKILQEEAVGSGISLRIKPTLGSKEALELVDQGKLDLALIQGGLENHYPHVVHVATVLPELLHLIVRPDITEVTGLKGKLVNLGSRKGGTRIVAQQMLEFSGLSAVDYTESNLGAEELIAAYPGKLPDAIILISSAPSEVAEFLVKERGYQVLEIPFPASLALRLGWVTDSKMVAYTYNVNPPVPRTDIRTIGVNLHLVANEKVDPRAVYKVLETLFSPGLEVRLRMKMDEAQLTVPSGYPLAEGTKKFLVRNNPIFSAENFEKIKSFLGLFLSIASALLIAFKWFKGNLHETKEVEKFASANELPVQK